MSALDRPTSDLLQSQSGTSAARLNVPGAIDAEVATARDEARLGHASEAIARLESLVAGDPAKATIANPGSLGSALVVLARAYLAAGRGGEAQSAYERALPLLDPARSELNAQQWSDRGIGLYSQGQLNEAIAALEEARSRQREPSAETLASLGVLLNEANRLDEAEEALRAAATLGPDRGVQLALAKVATALGRPDASALYKMAVEYLLPSDDLQQLAEAVDGLLALEPDNPSGLAAKGELLRRQSRVEEAIPVLERAIALEPNDSLARASLGSILARDPIRRQEALDHLDRAVTLDPDYAFAHSWRTVALIGMGRLDDAIQVAETHLPSNADVQTLIGVTLIESGDYERALTHLDAALAIKPGDGRILEAKGGVFMALSRFEMAVESFRQSTQIEATDYALSAVAEALSRLGGPQEALQEFDRITAALPSRAATLRVRGGLLFRAGRGEESIREFEGSVAIEPTSLAFVGLSAAYRAAGRNNEALEAAKRAVDADPTSAALVQLADSYRADGRNEEALDAARQAVDIEPENAVAIATRAQALRALERFDEALRDLDGALELRRDQPWIYLEKAAIQEATNLHEAIATLQAGVTENAGDTNLLRALATDQRLLDDFDEAESNIRRAIELDPDILASRMELGEILFASGNYKQALETVEDVLARESRHSRATQLKGQILVLLGQNEEAIPILDDALSLDPGFDWGWGLKAIAYAATDRPTKALACVNEALEKLPEHPTLLIQKAMIHNLSAEYEDAVTTVERVSDTPAQSWDAQTRAWADGIRGVAYFYVGRVADAEAAIGQTLKVMGEDIWTRLWFAYAILAGGRIEEAHSRLRDVIGGVEKPHELQPTDVASIGWAHRLLGEYEQAASLLVRAVSQDHNLVWAQFDFALALLCSGADSAASPEYERGLDQLRTWPDARRRFGLLSVALKDLEDAHSRPWGLPPLSRTPTVERLEAMLRNHIDSAAAERDGQSVASAVSGSNPASSAGSR